MTGSRTPRERNTPRGSRCPIQRYHYYTQIQSEKCYFRPIRNLLLSVLHLNLVLFTWPVWRCSFQAFVCLWAQPIKRHHFWSFTCSRKPNFLIGQFLQDLLPPSQCLILWLFQCLICMQREITQEFWLKKSLFPLEPLWTSALAGFHSAEYTSYLTLIKVHFNSLFYTFYPICLGHQQIWKGTLSMCWTLR